MESLTNIFNVLSGIHTDDLRKMEGFWGLRSAGNKKNLIFRVYLFFEDFNNRHLDVSSKMYTNLHCPRFYEFQAA